MAYRKKRHHLQIPNFIVYSLPLLILLLCQCQPGHIYIQSHVNNTPVKLIADTGASVCVLPTHFSPRSTSRAHFHGLAKVQNARRGYATFAIGDEHSIQLCMFTNKFIPNHIAALPLLREVHPILILSPSAPQNSTRLHASITHDLPLLKCIQGGKTCFLLVDTGAKHSVLAQKYSNQKLPVLTGDLPRIQTMQIRPISKQMGQIQTRTGSLVIGLLGLDYLRQCSHLDLERDYLHY